MDEKMREEFEEWITSPPLEKPVHRNPESSGFPGQYRAYEVQLAWESWQASRAALVVELPEKISQYNTDDTGFVSPAAAEHDEAIDDCRAAIEAAGVRVKP